MGNATSYITALVLLGFWLFLPLGMMLMGVGGYSFVDGDVVTTETGITVSILNVYFRLLFFEIPSMNIFIRYFVRFLQFATAVAIVFFLRGL